MLVAVVEEYENEEVRFLSKHGSIYSLQIYSTVNQFDGSHVFTIHTLPMCTYSQLTRSPNHTYLNLAGV